MEGLAGAHIDDSFLRQAGGDFSASVSYRSEELQRSSEPSPLLSAPRNIRITHVLLPVRPFFTSCTRMARSHRETVLPDNLARRVLVGRRFDALAGSPAYRMYSAVYHMVIKRCWPSSRSKPQSHFFEPFNDKRRFILLEARGQT